MILLVGMPFLITRIVLPGPFRFLQSSQCLPCPLHHSPLLGPLFLFAHQRSFQPHRVFCPQCPSGQWG